MEFFNGGNMLLFILLGYLTALKLVVCTTPGTDFGNGGTNNNLTAARIFLNDYNERLRKYHYTAYVDYFSMVTNMTKKNKETSAKSSEAMDSFKTWATSEARKFNLAKFPADIQRQLTIIRRGASPKDPDIRWRIIELEQGMQATFHSAKLQVNDTFAIEQSSVNRYLADVDSLSERRRLWGAFASELGLNLRENFTEIVQLYNDGARENGYNNMVEYWLDKSMEDRHYDSKCWDLWERIAPTYRLLHAYIRSKIMERYPDDMKEWDPIPIHLKNKLFTLAVPYPEVSFPDITGEMERQGYTVKRMYEMAEDFFVSLGMSPMTEAFWKNSMIEKPVGRKAQCWGAAFDMFDEAMEDFRILFCTRVDQKNFKTVHHEMGHIQYYMEYKHQPTIYRRAPNNGFHEAIGDVIGRSFETVTHLRAVGLLNKSDAGREEDQKKIGMNDLMSQAIKKLFKIPYILVIDGWRAAVFNGSTDPSNYNRKWWEMRVNYEGVSPPLPRSDDHLDAGMIFHVAKMVPADMRYFVSFLVQFQFQKALCEAANHKGPLYMCDIYGSKEAGAKLRAAMKLGCSKPWQDVLEQLTGQREIDPSAMLEYFQPLTDWLNEYNKKNNVTEGWDTNYLKYFTVTAGCQGTTTSNICIIPFLFLLFSLL